jgi:hypothetical protein
MAKRKINNPNQLSAIPLFDADAFMEGVKDVIAQSIIDAGRSATGKAVKSLSVEKIDDERFAIMAVPYLDNIQKGNAPSNNRRSRMGKSKWLTAPEFALADRLKQGWLQSRNLPIESAIPIARSIVSKGDITYQKGGEDVWNTNVSTYIDEHLEEFVNLEQYLNFETI